MNKTHQKKKIFINIIHINIMWLKESALIGDFVIILKIKRKDEENEGKR